MPRKPVRAWNATASRRGNGSGSGATDSRSLSPRSCERLTPPLPEAPSKTAPYKPALVFALTYCVGHSVSVQTRNGDCFEGILHTPGLVQSDVHFVLKKARKTTQEGGEKDFIERLVIPSTEVVQLYAKDLPIHSEPPSRPSSSPVMMIPIRTQGDNVSYRFGDFDDIGFLGDKDQERVGAGLFGRELQKWQPDGDGSCLEFDDTDHEVGTWDQFAENEKKFGIKTDFNMDLYTTRLEPEKSRYTVAQAEKLARAIQSASSPNLHLQDERNQLAIDDSGVSEEMLYSSVMASEQPGEKNETDSETPKKSETPEKSSLEERATAVSPKSPEAKRPGPITLILPQNHSRPMIINNRQNSKLDARAEFNRVAKQISSDVSWCMAAGHVCDASVTGLKAIPHGSPLETSPLVNDFETLKALNLTPGIGRKTLPPADRDRFRRFKEESERHKRVETRGEALAKLRPFQVKDDRGLLRKTPTKSENGSPFTQAAAVVSTSATPSALERDAGFGSQILKDEDNDVATVTSVVTAGEEMQQPPEDEEEEETEEEEAEADIALMDVKTQQELPRLITDHDGDEDELPEENSGRGLNPHAMPFNPGQTHPNKSESNVPLTENGGSDSTTAAAATATTAEPSPRVSPTRDLSESPTRDVKPFCPESLEDFPPLPPPQIPERVITPVPQPPQQPVLIRPQPPPPPPRVVTPPPPPAMMTEVRPAPPMVVPMVMRPPPIRQNRQSPSPGSHRTPPAMHQETQPSMMHGNPPPMMPVPHSGGPPSQSSGPTHPSNGPPPQMMSNMMSHMSGAMHMMPQPMAHYPYSEMAGRVPIIYPYGGHMAPVPGPPAPPGQQNNPNADQPMPPPHMVYPAYYPAPMSSYHVSSYVPSVMPPGLPPQYVPVAPAPMTPQRPGSGPRPKTRRKPGSFFYGGPRRG